MKYEFEQEYKKIGLKIAYYRKLEGLTQEMLAERLGVATSYIGQIEAAGMYNLSTLQHIYGLLRLWTVCYTHLTHPTTTYV